MTSEEQKNNQSDYCDISKQLVDNNKDLNIQDEDKEDLFDMNDLADIESMSKTELIKVVQAYFRGPIPHPTILKGYEEVQEGAADRIIRMAENQEKHRHDVEAKLVKTESRDSLLGILSAFFIAVLILVCGTLIIIKVPNVAGIISGSLLNMVGIGTVVGTFLRGARHSWDNDKGNEDEK